MLNQFLIYTQAKFFNIRIFTSTTYYNNISQKSNLEKYN